MKKFLFFVLLLFLFWIANTPETKAAALNLATDTITTSRPSASSALDADQAASATQVTIHDNGSMFLASDSATFVPDTSAGETINAGINVASMSANGIPAAGQRVVYFTGTVANAHHKGDPVISPVTAMHKIQFTTQTSIPASGKIVITFPGSANTSASPSATTFAFNGLTTANATANISYKLDGTRTCTFTIASPAITCTMDSGGALAGNTTVTFLIGCGDSSSNETSCTAQSPRLINPTKTAAAGTADTWLLNIKTQDNNSIDLDSAKLKIGTIDSVQIQAQVDPTLTFTIAGVANAGNVNVGNTTGCTTTDTTNSGFTPTATGVDMGVLSSGAINIAAQLLTITTNAANGYTLTATSSGHLINPANGHWINDSTTPTVMTAGTPWFGFRPCALDIAASPTWAASDTETGGGTGAKYAWPTLTSSLALASDSSGPIGNSLTAGNGLITMAYAATVDATIPEGLYSAVVTYVATPSF